MSPGTRRHGARWDVMAGDDDKAWVRDIGKALREDVGDCPTLPDGMVKLLDKLKDLHPQSSGSTTSPASETTVTGSQRPSPDKP